MLYVNFSFNSRRFVLLFRDSFQENFRFVKILFVASFTEIRSVTSWLFQRIWIERQVKYIHRFQRKNFILIWRFSFNSRISTSNWRFYLIIRVFRRAIFAKFDRITVNLAEFKTRNRVLEIVNHRHCWLKKIALKTSSSQIDRFCFFLLVDRLVTSVKFTSFVTMKIKYNVKSRVWLEINK